MSDVATRARSKPVLQAVQHACCLPHTKAGAELDPEIARTLVAIGANWLRDPVDTHAAWAAVATMGTAGEALLRPLHPDETPNPDVVEALETLRAGMLAILRDVLDEPVGALDTVRVLDRVRDVCLEEGAPDHPEIHAIELAMGARADADVAALRARLAAVGALTLARPIVAAATECPDEAVDVLADLDAAIAALTAGGAR